MGTTRSSATDDQITAMNAPYEDLPRLCREGNELACRLLQNPDVAPPSEEKLAQMAAERERQAQAERAHTARKLVSAGVNPEIARAVIEQRDVHYAQRCPEGHVAAGGGCAWGCAWLGDPKKPQIPVIQPWRKEPYWTADRMKNVALVSAIGLLGYIVIRRWFS
jgi:hypothetical protein